MLDVTTAVNDTNVCGKPSAHASKISESSETAHIALWGVNKCSTTEGTIARVYGRCPVGSSANITANITEVGETVRL